MFHDILLSCLSLQKGTLPLRTILESGAVDEIFHPGEAQVLSDIIDLLDSYREIAIFAKIYTVHVSRKYLQPQEKTEEPVYLKDGIYLRALCSGLNNLLEIYYMDMEKLEEKFLKTPTFSAILIYRALHDYIYLQYVSTKVLRGIETMKYHGCALLQYLNKCAYHGDPEVVKAMQIIMEPVFTVFLRQLTNWILYARCNDPYGEFFIQSINDRTDSASVTSENGPSNSRNPLSNISEINDKSLNDSDNKLWEFSSNTSSSFDSIWQYEIVYEMIPKFLSAAYAEKIFFVGQTVLIFKMDAKNCFEEGSSTLQSDPSDKGKISLWNNKEADFFQMVTSLNNETLSSRNFEMVIDEIKDFVTKRLLEIAVTKADLVKQLDLIKDFFLLGRGELFLEFIRLVHVINEEEDNETKLPRFIKCFEQAANSVGITDQLDQFMLRIMEADTDVVDISTEFGFLQQICFEFKIIWPLQLLFSPKVLERYNILFRFLILIKKLQFDLNAVWLSQNFCAKNQQEKPASLVVGLRNNLIFFFDNLQYYIQADVLESQFSILKATITSKTDFEQIQKAHSVFQANVLSLCFLLMDDETEKISISQATTLLNSSNPVYVIIVELCHIVDDFCYEVEKGDQFDGYYDKIETMDKRFHVLVGELMEVFMQYKDSSCVTPLSQFLLRLDFTRWFSENKKKYDEVQRLSVNDDEEDEN